MNKIVIFNYGYNIILTIIGLILLITRINIFLGIMWTSIGIVIIVLQRKVVINYKKQMKETKEFFEKIKKRIEEWEKE